jgi:hypothetical protein
VSRWRRATRWEFWPPYVFYPPVLLYLAYLMVKYRSATLFTCVNPSIPAGGFIGESKFDIISRLARSSSFVGRAMLLPKDLPLVDRVDRVQAFVAAHALDLPLVVKPNEGQRGSGVVIARTEETLRQSLGRTGIDLIVQEYVDGPEFGVFYYRHPAAANGQIFSLTEKRLPAVIGNGRDTLETLILADDRAVCQARLYFERHHTRLDDVPAKGAVVPLAELGTHCRGALFLDGAWVGTPALAARIDQIARDFDGFYFGRFDIRAAGGVDALREGHGFKIVELNGVTSEATHIYDPGTSLWAAYRVLRAQWRLAFEIGAENCRRGVRPTPVRELLRALWAYRATARSH